MKKQVGTKKTYSFGKSRRAPYCAAGALTLSP